MLMQIVEKNEKMKYNTLLDTLQNLINYKPKQSELCKVLGYNASTVGARAQRNSNFSDEEIEKIERYYAIELSPSSNANTVELDYYPDVYGSCGNGCMIFEESPEKISVTKDAIASYNPNNKYSVIVARGQSNEPTIMNNDKLIVQHIDNNSIIDNQLYVFSYEGQVYVKRLIKNIDEIVIISDNPDKTVYRTQYVSKSKMNEVKIIGKIIGLLRENI